MTNHAQARALAARRAEQEQLALDRRPPVREDDAPCSVCLGAGGWHAPATLDEPEEWVECWACDQPTREETPR